MAEHTLQVDLLEIEKFILDTVFINLETWGKTVLQSEIYRKTQQIIKSPEWNDYIHDAINNSDIDVTIDNNIIDFAIQRGNIKKLSEVTSDK